MIAKKTFSKEKSLYHENILWTREMQVWQPWRKFFDWMALFFWHKVRKTLKPLGEIQKLFFIKIFLKIPMLQFWQLRRFFSANWKKKFAQNFKRNGWWSFLFWNSFFLTCYSGHLLQFWKPWKNFSLSSQKLIKNPKTLKNLTFFFGNVALKVVSWTCRMEFWQPCE